MTSLQVLPADSLGQTAGAFVQRGFGPRGIAMGNAQVADAFGQGSPWYNPALSPFYADQSVEASYTFLSHDRTLEYIQFLVPMRPKAGVAAGLVHAGVSDIDGRDASGYHTDTYSTDEFGGFLSFGSRVGSKAAIGIAFRFYRSDLLPDLDPATSIGLSLGMMYQVSPDWVFGAAVDDILSRYEWDSSDLLGSSGRKTTDKFPVRLRFGSAYRLMDSHLLISAEYESRFEELRTVIQEVDVVGGAPGVFYQSEKRTLHSGSVRIGAEYQLTEIFAVRAGLDRIGDGGVSGLVPAAGFAVQQDLGDLGANFHYVFGREPHGFGSFHVIGVQLNL